MEYNYNIYRKYTDGNAARASGETPASVEEFTPGDSSLWEPVGGIDPDTGVRLIPYFATKANGLVVDKDHGLETLWFKAKGELADAANILGQFPTNTSSSLPLAAHNGISAGWKTLVQSLTNAPIGLTGYASYEVKTIGKYCEVIISNNGGKVYNYTDDLGADTIVWSGWKFVPTMDELAEVGGLFAASGPQTIKQVKIWKNSNGTFSMGEKIVFASALLSIAGRLGIFDGLLDDDAVNVRQLKAAVLGMVKQSDLTALQTAIEAELATKSNTGHGHSMGEIVNLIQTLDNFLNKGVFGGGQPYFALARDADGLATLVDLSGARLLIEELPPAQRGVPYSYTIQASQFIWPFGSVNQEVVIVCAAKVRGSQGWLTITEHNTSTGNTLSGTAPATPDYDSETTVTVIMKWRMASSAREQQARFPLPLAIYSTTASIVAPNPVLSFIATTVSAYEIALNWEDNSSNESGFEIDYRINDTGDWTRLITKQAGAEAHSHTGLTPETPYYYRIRSINGAGASDYEYSNAATSAVTAPPADDWVWSAGTGRLKNTGTVTPPVVTPPTTGGGNFYGTGRPKIDWIMQSNAAIQPGWIVWKNKNTGALGSFENLDQNNNPSQFIPTDPWEIYDIPEARILIDRARRAGYNGITFVLRWELLQISNTRYLLEIPAMLNKMGWELDVKIRYLIVPGIGNGSRPLRPGESLVTGHDQSATWRYMLEDVAQAFIFAGDLGSGVPAVNTISYGATLLPPSLYSTRAKTNFKALVTAFCNAMKNDPYRPAMHDELEMILSPTGETHIAIDDGKWADGSDLAMLGFQAFVNTLPSSQKSLFGNFVYDYSQRDFMRGWGNTEAYKLYDWWMQQNYMTPYHQELGDLVRSLGFKWAANHGSLSDHANDRVNKFFMDARFITPYDEVKQNPAGGRYLNKEYGGAIEQHIIRACGKLSAQELTPGALADFGNDIPTAIAACTKAMKDAMDAGAQAIFHSFVSDEDKAMNIGKVILDNVTSAGYRDQRRQDFTSVQNISVDLNYIFGKSWYQESEANARPVKDMDDAIAALVAGGMPRKQAIQRVGFVILPTQSPVANTPVLPNAPVIEWVHRTSSTDMEVRYTNNHTATALIEIQARQVGTASWYAMKNDGTLVLSTGSPLQLSTSAGASSTLNTTLSFYNGKVMEFRARAVVGSLSSQWSNPVSE